ncbi:MAG: hypothetical protein AAF702_23445 [Chloroflexota bacterium]
MLEDKIRKLVEENRYKEAIDLLAQHEAVKDDVTSYRSLWNELQKQNRRRQIDDDEYFAELLKLGQSVLKTAVALDQKKPSDETSDAEKAANSVVDPPRQTKPTFEIGWQIFTIKDLEPISFMIGLVIGIGFVVISIATNTPAFLVRPMASAVATAVIEEYESEKQTPDIRIIEDSGSEIIPELGHYKVRPGSSYDVIIEPNIDQNNDFLWLVEPARVAEIIPSPAGKKFRVSDESIINDGARIFLCERDSGTNCHGPLGFKIVVSK